MDYFKIKELIDNADCVIIGAGSGMDIDMKDFENKYPELVNKYSIHNFNSGCFHEFKTEEERWGFWSKYIDYNYNLKNNSVYKKLFNLIKDKEYFVITTNTDNMFVKSGFDGNKVFESKGNITKMQCAVGCHNTLYDDLDVVNKMIKYKEDVKVPSSLIPYCPICEGRMEVNMMKDAFFVKDDNWNNLNYLYKKFISDNKDKKVILLELGVGVKTPDIIRYPFEKLAYNLKNTKLIRVNYEYNDIPFEIKMKAINIKTTPIDFINKLSDLS